jgi:hypothetical protein
VGFAGSRGSLPYCTNVTAQDRFREIVIGCAERAHYPSHNLTWFPTRLKGDLPPVYIGSIAERALQFLCGANMALHQRSEKNSHLDTLLYEIDMLRHCERAVRQRVVAVDAPDAKRADYYLAIEGFLLHLRNLLAFLTNRKSKDTDIIINEPEMWAGRHVDQREYSDLIKACRELDRRCGVLADGGPSTCYDEISKYLQHCTTFRYERAKQWPVEEIHAGINPLLEIFEARFAGDATNFRAIQERASGTAGSTGTFRIIGSPSADES